MDASLTKKMKPAPASVRLVAGRGSLDVVPMSARSGWTLQTNMKRFGDIIGNVSNEKFRIRQ